MINRANFAVVQTYLKYCGSILKNTPKTVEVKRWHLRHLLEWADEVPLSKLHTISEPLPDYLESRALAYATQQDTCHDVRQFLHWLKERNAAYRTISGDLIASLHPGRNEQAEPRNRNVWSIEEVRKIAQIQNLSLTLQRAQAATVLLFLSGMRIAAFVTLPILAIDLPGRAIRQWPALGVRTKLSKAATTYLLDIPDLLAVARAWDNLVRLHLAETNPWYAHIHSDGTCFVPDQPPTPTRFRKELRQLAELAGVPYKRPHDLRHGHAIYALEQTTNLGEFKSVSQNLMHESLLTTDRIYGVLNAHEAQMHIAGLGKTKNAEIDFSAFEQRILTVIQQGLSQDR